MQDHPCSRRVPIDADMDIDHEDYASMVNWVMRHSKCGTYCLRQHKQTKQDVCRFKYPFQLLQHSKIQEEPEGSKMLRFYGHRNDELVCSHNRKVLQTWRANIDWSPVLSIQSVVNYIGKYAAKCEPASKTFKDTLLDIVSDQRRPCEDVRSAAKRLLIRFVSERDISAQEVCHLLMGFPLFSSSRSFILLNLHENAMLSSRLRQVRNEDNAEGVPTDPNFFARYLERPQEYTDITLLQMAKQYFFNSGGWHKSKKELVVRVIPEIEGSIIKDSDKWESYCRQQVLLHHHYRSLDEAKGTFQTWSQTYDNLGLGAIHPTVLPDPVEEHLEDPANEEVDLHSMIRDEWMVAAAMGPLFSSIEDVLLGMRDYDISHNWDEGLQRYPNIELERKFVQNVLRGNHDTTPSSMAIGARIILETLSHEQRLAHDLVIRSLQCSLPIRLIVCGGAGTGKSTLIKAIVQTTKSIFLDDKVVRLMAPTGVAAFNIGGSTIHHELSIPVNQPILPLTGEQAIKMQEDFRTTKLIIIDEYSMLGRSMLNNIDLRCRDIFSKNEPFGNVSIMLVGDMRQLPPVCDSPLYLTHGRYNQTCGGIAYASFDKCIRLNHIFRQSGDDQAGFRDALLRISNGTTSAADWELFKTRDISMLSLEEFDKFKYALRLFPTKKGANEYNRQRLLDLGKPVARVSAINNCETASRSTSDEAKGLENVLCLSVGARVMLRSNLATDHGLVNGAMGIVNDIVYLSSDSPPNGMPTAVIVHFDTYHGPKFREGSNLIPITPQTSHWRTSSGTTCQRTQLPLILCWAITIHKSQGMTLDAAVVDIGETESLGLSFVALSRTRKLCDLAFSPMFTYERIHKIQNCKGLQARLQEEDRLTDLANSAV